MFQLKENQTNIKRELIAGMTTFFTMVYIVAVNPGILSKAGIPLTKSLLQQLSLLSSVRSGWHYLQIIQLRLHQVWG